MKSIIIGAGTDLGVHINGSRYAPNQLIKDLKSVQKVKAVLLEQNKNIIKNRNISNRRKNEEEVNIFNNTLYQVIVEKEQEGFIPVVVGGDHSVSIASILASSYVNQSVGLLYFSAHADFNTYETTPSGNINGMTLATVLGYKQNELRIFHKGNLVDHFKTCLIGTRSIDPRELDNINYVGINTFTTKDLQTKDLKAIIDKAFEIASVKTKKIHVCFDLSIIDSTVATGVNIAEADGIDEKTMMKILDLVLDHLDNICCFDLVELNPLQDNKRKTEQIALNILAKIYATINTTLKKE